MAIKINVASLKDGSQTLEFMSDALEIGLEKDLIKDKLIINIDLFKVSHQIDLKISLEYVLKLVCDRCLEIFVQPTNSYFELVFIQKHNREKSFDDGYVRTFNPYMTTIDITKDIREYIMLSIPMKHLPPENKDGSCSWCGKSKEYWKEFIKEENSN